MSKSNKQPVDVIQTIEHYIEEQDGIWQNTLTLPVFKNDSLYLYVKNDGDYVNFHKSIRPNGLKSEFWNSSSDIVQILKLQWVDGIKKWVELRDWRMWITGYLKRYEIDEILL